MDVSMKLDSFILKRRYKVYKVYIIIYENMPGTI